jgi:squalene cyclase
MRHPFLVPAALAALLAAAAPASLRADDPPPTADMTPAIRRAVDRGLAWLADHQNDNGSWSCKIGYKLMENYLGKDGDHVGVTGLAGLALLGGGNVPHRGRYGDEAAKALDFVLSCVRPEDGYITHQSSRMYEHAFATLFLAEVHGMSPREDVRLALKSAVNLLVRAQNADGGWRYQPTPFDADLSVTVSTLQALRAARNVGIAVPKTTIDRAVRYIRACANEDGSFSYQLGPQDTRTSFALTACGVVSLHSLGDYASRDVQQGVEWLIGAKPRRLEPEWKEFHYFYGHYYAAQAFYLARGKAWRNYWTRVSSDILGHQQPDGHWDDDVGPAYATAMACIILQIPCEYLPIFQK